MTSRANNDRVGAPAETTAGDSSLALARDQWREETRQSIHLQLLLGVMLYVFVAGIGFATFASNSEGVAVSGCEASECLDWLSGTYSALAVFIDQDGAAASIGIAQVVAALAIALLASRFPAVSDSMDAVAVSHWSRNLKWASTLASSIVVAMAVGVLAGLLAAMFSDLPMRPGPLPGLIIVTTAFACVVVTASSRVAGVDAAGIDLLRLRIAEGRERLQLHRSRQKGSRDTRAMGKLRRTWRWLWPTVLVLPLLALWFVGSDWRSLLTPAGAAQPFTAASVYLLGWLGTQAAGIGMQFAGVAFVEPVWVEHYESKGQRAMLGLALVMGLIMALLDILTQLLFLSSLPLSGSLKWDLLFMASAVAPALLRIRLILPRSSRAGRTRRVWRPEPGMEARVLHAADERLDRLAVELKRQVSLLPPQTDPGASTELVHRHGGPCAWGPRRWVVRWWADR